MIYACCLGLYVKIITEAVLSYMPLLYLQRLRPSFFQYGPPLSTVDSIVSEKLYVFISCHYMRVYYIHTYAHTYRLFFIYTYCIYVRFPYLGHVSSVRVFGKSCHELTRTRRSSCSRIIASGALLRSRLSRK